MSDDEYLFMFLKVYLYSIFNQNVVIELATFFIWFVDTFLESVTLKISVNWVFDFDKIYLVSYQIALCNS